ncbi:MAG TPA: hypothetical protein VMG40_20220 [Bryobacteraceae bacterium]|nr:hypothetical protein [Bryobacteraceae bacterium]
MKLFLALIASVSCVLGGVDGVVMNGTTGQPQPNVIITMVQPGAGGMQTLATVKSDAQGIFKIEERVPPGPVLLQAIYGAVIYTKMLPPGSPTNNLDLQVFDATTNPESGKVAQDMILLEPGPGGIAVTETILCNNATKQTFEDPKNGSVRFFVAEAARGNIQVTVSSPNGMPIQRPAEKTKSKGVYKVDYALKPGETRFDIAYSLPAGDTFRGERIDAGTPLRLVTPGSVTLSGDGVDMLGQEPQTQARIYDVKNASYAVKIEGTGSLRSTDASAQGEQDDGHPQVESDAARIYTQKTFAVSDFYWVLGLAFAVLGLGGVMLYRKGAA